MVANPNATRDAAIDGDQVVYMEGHPTGADIHVFNLSTGKDHRITYTDVTPSSTNPEVSGSIVMFWRTSELGPQEAWFLDLSAGIFCEDCDDLNFDINPANLPVDCTNSY